ncbi:MAG: hypothetical protein QXH20_00485 [Candidatus Bathyarchaeia archaeon]
MNPRTKGKRVEYQIRDMLRKWGECHRVPCSGNARGFKGDLHLYIHNKEYRVEVKARKQGFKQIQEWLANASLLIIKLDRQEPIVILRLSTLEELCGLGKG